MSSITERLAEALFLSGCVKFGEYRIKSGALSPYYIDLARLLSVPKELCSVTEIAAEVIKQTIGSKKIDKLASIELKGALLLPSIACKIPLPCVVVRKEKKGYGVTGRIAGGEVVKGENILFFDDVISEGLSKLEGIKPLEQLGAKIEHLMVVIDREQGGKENLEKLGYKVHALAKISDVVNTLAKSRKISNEQAEAVFSYIKK